MVPRDAVQSSIGRTADYTICTISGVGGAPRKGRPYPDGLRVCLVDSLRSVRTRIVPG